MHRGPDVRLAEATGAVSRSAPSFGVDGLVFECREALREHAEYVARTRQAWQAAQAGAERPPFAGRGGGVVRSEPVTCPNCIALGASPEESFRIHHEDADGNMLAAAPDVPVSVPPDDSERAVYAESGWEISR